MDVFNRIRKVRFAIPARPGFKQLRLFEMIDGSLVWEHML